MREDHVWRTHQDTYKQGDWKDQAEKRAKMRVVNAVVVPMLQEEAENMTGKGRRYGNRQTVAVSLQ